MKHALLFLACASCAACLPRVGGLLDAGVEEVPRPAHCSDATQNEGETGLDCGGACDGCAEGAVCAVPTDCLSGVCVALSCRAVAQACRPAFTGCQTFVDATADAGSRTITFPIGGLMFTPSCLRIKLGQTVTFMSSDNTFSAHPLVQACGPIAGVLGATMGSSKDFTFTSAIGRFGFFCDQHGTGGGDGMAGAIEVVP